MQENRIPLQIRGHPQSHRRLLLQSHFPNRASQLEELLAGRPGNSKLLGSIFWNKFVCSFSVYTLFQVIQNVYRASYNFVNIRNYSK